jgi:hypothetical protein
MQVRGQDIMELDLAILKKQLRVTSRRELKGWVVSLTKGLIETQQKIPSDSEMEENEKAKKLYTTQVQVLEAELLSCSQAAKEFKKGREEAENLLMRKEKEGLRAAQSMVGTSPLHHSPLLSYILSSFFSSSPLSFPLYFPKLSSFKSSLLLFPLHLSSVFLLSLLSLPCLALPRQSFHRTCLLQSLALLVSPVQSLPCALPILPSMLRLHLHYNQIPLSRRLYDSFYLYDKTDHNTNRNDVITVLRLTSHHRHI